MVKDSKTPAPKPGRLPRPKRGRPPTGEDARDHRLMMRVHHGLVDLIDIRASERGESRSRFIERLLIAYLNADPRNPEIDASGRLMGDGAAISRTGDPVKFGAAWGRWSTINENIFDWKPGDKLRDEDPSSLTERLTGQTRQPDQDD
jgi:hypothetical protein